VASRKSLDPTLLLFHQAVISPEKVFAPLVVHSIPDPEIPLPHFAAVNIARGKGTEPSPVSPDIVGIETRRLQAGVEESQVQFTVAPPVMIWRHHNG
jgi:hypothetical protein